MSNALATLNGGAELTELEQEILAESEAENTAFDLMPSRYVWPTGFSRSFNDKDDPDDKLTTPFTAIILIAQKKRSAWLSKAVSKRPPICGSPDGIKGYFDPDSESMDDALDYPIAHPALRESDRVDAIGPWDCKTCVLNQWGSGKNRGKACKEMRQMILWIDGYHAPVLLSVPPSSIKTFDVYANKRKKVRGEAYFTFRTKFELVEGKSGDGAVYSELRLSVDSPLSDEEKKEVLQVRKEFESMIREAEVTADDYAVDVTPEAETEEAADMPF